MRDLKEAVSILSIEAENDCANLRIRGTDEDVLLNWLTLTLKVGESLHMTTDVLTAILLEMADSVKKAMRETVRLELGALRRQGKEGQT